MYLSNTVVYEDFIFLNSFEAMIGRIKTALDKIITSSNWMDNITKQKAIQKSTQIKPLVGFPDTVMDMVNFVLLKLTFFNFQNFRKSWIRCMVNYLRRRPTTRLYSMTLRSCILLTNCCPN